MCYKLVFEYSGFDPFECVLETVSRQPSVQRIWMDVSAALLQTNVADYVTQCTHKWSSLDCTVCIFRYPPRGDGGQRHFPGKVPG